MQTRCVRLSSAGQRGRAADNLTSCSSRGVSFVVDADNALGRAPACRRRPAGTSSRFSLDPLHGRRRVLARDNHIQYGTTGALLRRTPAGERPKCGQSEPRAQGLDQIRKTPPRSQACSIGMFPEKKPRSHGGSRQSRLWRLPTRRAAWPSEARMAEAGGGNGCQVRLVLGQSLA